MRIVGVDLARLLALLGMFAAHLVDELAGPGPGGVNGVFQVVAGRSSALFAVLAGVSLALVAGRDQVRADPRGHRLRLLVRVVLIAVLGLWLGLLGSGLAVILTYYGLLFCCALPLLAWSARRLLRLALAWGLLSPVVSLALRRTLPPPSLEVPSFVTVAQDPVGMLLDLLVTGYYPVLTWATYLITGLAVGRLLQEQRRRLEPLAARLALAGAALAVLALAVSALITRTPGVRAALLDSIPLPADAWPDLARELRLGFYGTHPVDSGWWLGVWAPHSGSVVDLVHTTGTALLVLGVCLWLVRLTPALPWSVISGAGRMTLTFYTAHVVLLATALGDVGPLARHTSTGWALQATLTVVAGAILTALHRRGPLEAIITRAVRLVPVRD